jgi:hypothetical protein
MSYKKSNSEEALQQMLAAIKSKNIKSILATNGIIDEEVDSYDSEDSEDEEVDSYDSEDSEDDDYNIYTETKNKAIKNEETKTETNLDHIHCDLCEKIIKKKEAWLRPTIYVREFDENDNPIDSTQKILIQKDLCSWLCLLRWMKTLRLTKNQVFGTPIINGCVKTPGVTFGGFWDAIRQIGEEMITPPVRKLDL